MKNQPSEAVQRGLKLLSARNRKLHPRAQVQSLRRIAVRATSDADWREGIPNQWHRHPPRRISQGPEADAEENEAIAKQRQKAADAIEAALYLNQEHGLGYNVPGPQ